MYRKWSRVAGALPILLVVGALLIGCGGTTWNEFNSAEGAFSVLMPGTPTEQTQTQDTDLGPIDVHTFTFEQGNAAYLVGYNVFPAAVIEASTPAAILDGARDGAGRDCQGHAAEREGDHAGHLPGA